MKTVHSCGVRYAFPLQALHWGMAALLACLFVLGWVMTSLDPSSLKGDLYAWHQSLGICAGLLWFARAAARLLCGSPYLAARGTYAETLRFCARFVHVSLYVLMLAAPLTGWGYASASGFSARLFGFLPLPEAVPRSEEASRFFHEAHELTVFFLGCVICLHALAVMFHMTVLKDRLLSRMLPGGEEPDV